MKPILQVHASTESQPAAAAPGTRPARSLFGFTTLERRILRYCENNRCPFGVHHHRLLYWTRKGHHPTTERELTQALERLVAMKAIEQQGIYWQLTPGGKSWALRKMPPTQTTLTHGGVPRRDLLFEQGLLDPG